MSEVLKAFVDPYMDAVDTAEDFRSLVVVAALAWNVSFLPEEKQTEMLEEIVVEGIPDGDAEQRAGLRYLLHTMVARKQAHFSEHTRMIMDFEVTETRDRYHLAVASTMEPEAEMRSLNQVRPYRSSSEEA